MVVDSVSLMGVISMTHGGLHVTDGDVVSHISGTTIVDMLTLVVKLVLAVVLRPRSSEDVVSEVDRTEDLSAVVAVDCVLLLVSRTAVPTLAFEFVRELSIDELARLELLEISEDETRVADIVVVFTVHIVALSDAEALTIPVDAVIADGVGLASPAEVKFAGIRDIVSFNEEALDVSTVVAVDVPLLSNTRVEEFCIPKLVFAVCEAPEMENFVLEAKTAVPLRSLCDDAVSRTGIPVFVKFRVGEDETVRLL